MLTKYAAILASIILFSVLCFQILLILGKPLGEYAWGGKYKVLPTKLRVSSVISSIIYILCALIILENAGKWIVAMSFCA